MTEQQELLFHHFDHVAIAVRDIDEALRKMEDVLGLSATVTRDMNEDGYRAAIVPLRTGRLILVQPTDENGAIAEFLQDRGEGLHHVGFGVDDVTVARTEIGNRGGVLPADAARPRLTGISDFVDASVTGGVPWSLNKQPFSRLERHAISASTTSPSAPTTSEPPPPHGNISSACRSSAALSQRALAWIPHGSTPAMPRSSSRRICAKTAPSPAPSSSWARASMQSSSNPMTLKPSKSAPLRRRPRYRRRWRPHKRAARHPPP